MLERRDGAGSDDLLVLVQLVEAEHGREGNVGLCEPDGTTSAVVMVGPTLARSWCITVAPLRIRSAESTRSGPVGAVEQGVHEPAHLACGQGHEHDGAVAGRCRPQVPAHGWQQRGPGSMQVLFIMPSGQMKASATSSIETSMRAPAPVLSRAKSAAVIAPCAVV